MPRKLPLLLHDCGGYRWALDQALGFLEVQDGMRLVLAALESGDDGFLQLADWVMDGDAPFPKLKDSALLSEAAMLGCWEAGGALSQRLQRVEKYPIDWNKTSTAVPVEDSAFRRTMVAVTQSSYTFPLQALTTAAARGDLTLFRAATEARQLEVCDWLAKNMASLDCTLSLDANLQTVCCLRNMEYTASQQKLSLCATAKYGFKDTVEYDDGVSSEPLCALVVQLAHHGDVEMLKTLSTRFGHTGWDVDCMATCAVVQGHLPVLPWIYSTFQRQQWPKQERLVLRAAEHGHLKVLHWLWARQDMCDTDTPVVETAARYGNLAIVRWLQQHMKKTAWDKQAADAIDAAGRERAISRSLVSSMRSADCPCQLRGISNTPRHPQTSSLFIYRGFDARSSDILEISQFLYTHAQVRTSHLGTSLEIQINFDKIDIIRLATSGRFATARWLVECVAEAGMGKPFGSGNFNRHLHPSPDTQTLILACLRARPEQCRSAAWLPAWVVAANCFEGFVMLVDMRHPNVGDTSVCKSITNRVREARFMVKLLAATGVEQYPSYLVDEIIAWAAKVGAIPVLSSLDKTLTRGRIHLAIVNAVRYGHVKVLEWLHDHDREWLSMPEYEFQDSRVSVEKLVQEAAWYNHAECLQWLLLTLDVPVRVVADVLADAVTQRDVCVVGRLISHYAPETLPLSSVDRRLVGTFVSSCCQQI